MKSIIIMATSRGDGNTKQITEILSEKINSEIVEINNLDISYYDYHHENENDDFIPLIQKILEFDLVILSTPVYWYTMSAQLKTFLDRTSDLITIRKDLGRKLKGKKVFVLSSGSQKELPPHFEEPIILTADYFEMNYIGNEYFYFTEDKLITEKHKRQIEKLKESLGA